MMKRSQRLRDLLVQKVPFLRPSRLADDQATTQDVIGHALEWFQQQGQDL